MSTSLHLSLSIFLHLCSTAKEYARVNYCCSLDWIVMCNLLMDGRRELRLWLRLERSDDDTTIELEKNLVERSTGSGPQCVCVD